MHLHEMPKRGLGLTPLNATGHMANDLIIEFYDKTGYKTEMKYNRFSHISL